MTLDDIDDRYLQRQPSCADDLQLFVSEDGFG